MKNMFLVLLLLYFQAESGKFWEIKDYSEWSKKECEELLTDSPWAKAHRTGQQPVLCWAQFLSALPIRQAIVRHMQLNEDYENLEPRQNIKLEDGFRDFLYQSFDEAVVVNVAFSGQELFDYYKHQTTDTLKNSVFLTFKNHRIQLLDYQIPRGSTYQHGLNVFQLIFPRQYMDQTLLKDPDESIVVEFPYPGLPTIMKEYEQRAAEGNPALVPSQYAPGTIYIEFKVANMVVGEKVIY